MLDDIEFACITNKPCFVGSVILKQQPTPSNGKVRDIRTVIDGQQRLTTFSILFKILCLKTNENERINRSFFTISGSPVLRHNKDDEKAYTTVMAASSLSEILKLDSRNKIYAAAQFFADHLDEGKIDYDTAGSLIQFVGIDLNPEDDEQQIFDTINSLGVKLTTAELLKNYFFSKNQIDLYEKYWVQTFEKDDDTKAYWDTEISTRRSKRSFIDLFFYYFLQIKIQDGTLNVSAEHKEVYAKTERIFNSYKDFIKTYMDNNPILLLEEICDYAETFRRSFNLDVVNEELSADDGLARLNVIAFALETATLIPYILFIEHEVTDKGQKNELYRYVESFIMRRTITGATTRSYNRLFSEKLISNRVTTKEKLSDYFIEQEDKTNEMPSDEDLKDAFLTSFLTNKYATGVIYLIESKIRDRSRYATQLLGINKYSLEHMMPKKWRNNWDFEGTDDEKKARDRKLLTLGNLTIITQPLNTSIRDAAWKDKLAGKGDRGGLKKYSVGIETLYGALEEPDWNEATIEQRGSKLAKEAIKVWPIL